MDLKVRVYPEPILRKKAKNIEKIDDRVIHLLDEMADMMHKYSGIGLAAEQVGLLEKLVVIDLMPNGKSEPIFLINPEILYGEGIYEEHEEGCLSVPGYYDIIKDRKKGIKVQYIDRDGYDRTIETDEFLSVVLQHEIDHLNGKLFIDRLSPIRRSVFRREWGKLQKKRQEQE